ncbi:MAG TPA: EamA family transporter [Bacteroidia bacterium]|nr:EamA family transporter [Bacteroidia bacterium]
MGSSPHARSLGAGIGAVTVAAALLCQNVGAGFAKQLFPLVGPGGVTALRVGLAAAMMLLLFRPWRAELARPPLAYLIAYGLTLGGMNFFIYQAFARIPMGVAVAIEVVGPLMVALLGSRRVLDFVWLGFAVTGLLLLLPLRLEQALDPWGVFFSMAAALCWALYILAGKRLSATPGPHVVALGMVVATVVTLPLVWLESGAASWTWGVLWAGLAVAVLSSILPYTLEMRALRRIPSHVFGMLVSSAPALAALAGFAVLGERLYWMQWLAIGCMMAASAGSAWGSGGTGGVENCLPAPAPRDGV